jgi:acyl-CoA synthetase (NDP forming)
VREIKGFPLLQGYSGHPPTDVEALEELLLRTSFLVEEVPEIREIELNPVFALAPGHGARIGVCRIRLESPGPGQPVRHTVPAES